MPQMIALMLATLVFSLHSVAEASTQPRGSVYAATVEDGTPKVIRMKKTKVSEQEERVLSDREPGEQYLSDLEPAPAPVKPSRKIQSREPIAAKNSDDSEQVSIDSNAAAPSAPAADESMKQELSSLKKQVNDDINQRLASLEEKDRQEKLQKSQTEEKQKAAALRTAGEKVPVDKVDDVALRLKYAQVIVKRFGIAYDYRSMTVSDFKRVLKKLSAVKKSERSEAQTQQADN